MRKKARRPTPTMKASSTAPKMINDLKKKAREMVLSFPDIVSAYSGSWKEIFLSMCIFSVNHISCQCIMIGKKCIPLR